MRRVFLYWTMKHAGADALEQLSDLLDEIRVVAANRIVEKKTGVFYHHSRAFLHFHEDPTGLFADIRPFGEADFTRLAVNTSSERSELLEKIQNSFRRES